MTALSVRTALTITMFIGFIYAALGLIFSPTPTDFAVGCIIVAVASIAQGLIEWLDR